MPGHKNAVLSRELLLVVLAKSFTLFFKSCDDEEPKMNQVQQDKITVSMGTFIWLSQ
jgi:hypothetical protein